METISTYIENNKKRIIEELFDFIRIPSDSSKRNNIDSMQQAADFVKQSLLKVGADNAELIKTEGWPLVYAEKIIDPNLPTVLVYGHYDVQPPEPLDLWDSPPYEPVIRDGKIYARGADDNKGQLFMHVAAFEFMVSENCLPCNVKFIIEGEEEIGSMALENYVRKHKEKLEANVILVSDTTMNSLENPTITTGLRGLAYFELELTGQNRDLHSGLYGGVVSNPCNVLCGIIDKLVDQKGNVSIPGFYDSVLTVSEEERALLNSNPIDEEKFYKSIGLEKGAGEPGYTLIERLGIRPSCDVNGIWGGYTEEGAKTILPSKASAKISMRLVPNQNTALVKEQFEAYVNSFVPEGFSLNIKQLHGGSPYGLSFDSDEISAAVKAIEKSLNRKPLPFKSGGSIPIISELHDELKINAILLGFGLETDAIHAPNENFPLINFFKGIETIVWFYHYFTSPKK